MGLNALPLQMTHQNGDNNHSAEADLPLGTKVRHEHSYTCILGWKRLRFNKASIIQKSYTCILI
uniref:Uncharacterized protein n=1 Tax=Oryza brachyantha TaxID=4533 RepID=J3MPL5_ORYBR